MVLAGYDWEMLALAFGLLLVLLVVVMVAVGLCSMIDGRQ